MGTRKAYSSEFGERAVRMLLENEGEYPSHWAAVKSIAAKVRSSAEALRVWVQRAEGDSGTVAAVSGSDRERLKQLERDNFELRRRHAVFHSARQTDTDNAFLRVSMASSATIA